MIEGVKVRNVKVYKNKRGELHKVVEKEFVKRLEFGEVYLVKINPSFVRGKHFHSNANEWFTVVRGQVLLILEKDGERMELKLDAENPRSVEVPAGVKHAVKNTGDEKAYFLAYMDKSNDSTETVKTEVRI